MNFLNKILSIFKENNNEKEPWHDLYGNNIPPKLEYPTGSMYDAFYKAYVNKCGNIKFVDYIDNMLDITITSLRISFNNYIRHRGANDNNCLETKRYYAVSFINEIIFKLNINTYDLFEFYDGNGDECVRYMHKAFRNKNFDVSRELMDNFINDTVNAAKYISDWVKRANI